MSARASGSPCLQQISQRLQVLRLHADPLAHNPWPCCSSAVACTAVPPAGCRQVGVPRRLAAPAARLRSSTKLIQTTRLQCLWLAISIGGACWLAANTNSALGTGQGHGAGCTAGCCTAACTLPASLPPHITLVPHAASPLVLWASEEQADAAALPPPLLSPSPSCTPCCPAAAAWRCGTSAMAPTSSAPTASHHPIYCYRSIMFAGQTAVLGT